MSLGGSHSDTTSSSNTNQYGTRTPIVSSQFTNAYNNLFGYTTPGKDGAADVFTPGALNLKSGTTQDQQQALDWMKWALGPDNMAAKDVLAQNQNLSDLSRDFSGLDTNFYDIANGDTRQANAFNVAAPDKIENVSAGGLTGSELAARYNQLYGSQVTDPAMASFDYGTARALSELDARTGAGGGWANSRSSEIPYSDLLAQRALARGQLSSQLNAQGLTSALNFATQDANRLTQNNQFNTNTDLERQKFNAQLGLQANQFNAQQNQNNGQFNVQAATQQDQNRLAALNNISSNLQNRAGLSNQIVQNIVTANGINTAAAQNLFAAGTISLQQLRSILDSASAYNGSSYTENSTSQGSQSTDQFGAGVTLPIPR